MCVGCKNEMNRMLDFINSPLRGFGIDGLLLSSVHGDHELAENQLFAEFQAGDCVGFCKQDQILDSVFYAIERFSHFSKIPFLVSENCNCKCAISRYADYSNAIHADEEPMRHDGELGEFEQLLLNEINTQRDIAEAYLEEQCIGVCKEDPINIAAEKAYNHFCIVHNIDLFNK